MGFTPGISKLSDLTDVTVTSPTAQEVLAYNTTGSRWENADRNAQLIENVNTVAASGTTETLPDVTTATIHNVTLTANCTLSFPTAGAGKSFILSLKQDATGGRTVVWPGSVIWQDADPVLSSNANSQDIFSFSSFTGTGWTGFIVAQGF